MYMLGRYSSLPLQALGDHRPVGQWMSSWFGNESYLTRHAHLFRFGSRRLRLGRNQTVSDGTFGTGLRVIGAVIA